MADPPLPQPGPGRSRTPPRHAEATDDEGRTGMRSAARAPGGADRWSARGLDAARGLAVLLGARELQHLGDPVTLPGSPEELLIVLSALAAVAARRFPVPALVVAATMDALPYWLPTTGAGYHLSLMICLYMVVSRSPRRTATVAAGTAYAVQLGLMAFDRDWRLTDFFVLFVAMSNLVAVALGLATRSRRAAVRALQQRAEEAERSRDSEARKRVAEDRLRVARDLHDSVAHQIAVMNLNTTVATAALPDRPDDAQKALAIVHEAGRSVLASIGDLLTGLREENDDGSEPHYGIDELQTLVQEFRILVPTIDVDLVSLTGESTRAIGAVTYLVVREGLTNAYKHGDHDAPVEVRLRLDVDADAVWIRNVPREAASGSGAGPSEGFGLQGMRERVGAAGGRLDVTAAGGHFTLDAVVPHAGGGR